VNGQQREHMSWCKGDHDADGWCRIAETIKGLDGDDGDVQLIAQPCSGGIEMWVQAPICSPDDFDKVTARLAEMRELFEASFRETDCESHGWDCQPDEPD